MAYCVHCGVELAETEGTCPLCGTPVYDPAAPASAGAAPTYPPVPLPEKSQGPALLVLALALLIPFLSVFACDLTLQGGVTWSRYALIWMPLLYSLVFLPSLVKKHVEPICVLADAALLLAALYLLCRFLGGTWFFPFALPVTATAAGIVLAAVLLAYKVHMRPMGLAGTLFIGMGLFVVLLEYRINQCFYPARAMGWSVYPLIPCVLLGAFLCIVDGVPSLRAAFERKMHL